MQQTWMPSFCIPEYTPFNSDWQREAALARAGALRPFRRKMMTVDKDGVRLPLHHRMPAHK
jgi:hypothetical protein